jgi:hypothetical protein
MLACLIHVSGMDHGFPWWMRLLRCAGCCVVLVDKLCVLRFPLHIPLLLIFTRSIVIHSGILSFIIVLVEACVWYGDGGAADAEGESARMSVGGDVSLR